jgi:hypothetical protein
MADKEQQLNRLREAVDEKSEAAEQNRGEQPSLTDDSTPQDVDPRHKSSRKGHVTAENWNQ